MRGLLNSCVHYAISQAGALVVIHKCLKARHSDMDSRQAILPDTLRVNVNPLPADLCRNPEYMDVFETIIHGTGHPLPTGHDGLLGYLYLTMSAGIWERCTPRDISSDVKIIRHFINALSNVHKVWLAKKLHPIT